jgi:putative restriction endonuclease
MRESCARSKAKRFGLNWYRSESTVPSRTRSEHRYTRPLTIGHSLMTRRNWSRDELIVAFNLYCQIPFGRIHNRNPEIIALAKALARTPSALSWKLANFARFDPAVRGRNLSGATHGSALEHDVWEEFHQDWNKLAFESEKAKAKLLDIELGEELREDFPEGRVRLSEVAIRVNQAFFRSAVLAAYEYKCCITGLAIPELLCASHIVPWSVDIHNRTNPCNGLSLNAIHDRAFDRGLISIGTNYKVQISPSILKAKGEATHDLLLRYSGTTIKLSDRFRPTKSFLEYHNAVVFRHT